MSSAPYSSDNLALHVGDHSKNVRANRESLRVLVGPTMFMNQSHGDTVAVIDGISAYEPNADAMVTSDSGIALGVLVADCIPLLLWDEEEHVISVAHVGRRGLVNGIALRVLEVMASFGAGRIQALLGPSICGQCYEVGGDVYEEVVSSHGYAAAKTRKGTLALDLPKALMHELLQAGVKVCRTPICTAENANFFSYRRDGITGRQAGLIWQ